jgi:hypothetical protein
LNGKDSGSFPAVGKSSAMIPALQCTATGVYCSTFIGSAAPAYLGTVRKKKQKKGKEKKGNRKRRKKNRKKIIYFLEIVTHNLY